MARIRTIKPEFFTSLTVASVHVEARLTFVGLWTHVDDEGRCVDDARLIKAALWPLDDRTAADVERDLQALTEHSLIVRYEAAGRRYLAVRGWEEHQRINRPTPSKFPAPTAADGTDPPPSSRRSDPVEPSRPAEPEPPPPPLTESSLSPPGALTAGSGSGKGKDPHPRGLSRPARVVVEALGCDDDDAQWIADEVQRRHRPKRLAGYLRRMAEGGDLAPLLAERHQARPADPPPPTGLEPPCGDCGPGRLIELDDGRAARCPNCHPSTRRPSLRVITGGAA